MDKGSIQKVWQTNGHTIIVELDKDITLSDAGFLSDAFIKLDDGRQYCTLVDSHADIEFSNHSGYFKSGNDIIFVFPSQFHDKSSYGEKIFVACENSNWGDAINSPTWQMKYNIINGQAVLSLPCPAENFHNDFEFKFISETGTWINPSDHTQNICVHSDGVKNFKCFLQKTGKHAIKLISHNLVTLRDTATLVISDGTELKIDSRPFLFKIYSDQPLGAIISGKETTFRLFAPRAKNVRVGIKKYIDSNPIFHAMLPENDGTWSLTLNANLNKQYYFFQLTRNSSDDIELAPRILDPYARATVSRDGPGIILKERNFRRLRDNFKSPNIKDAVIVESHIRDVLAKAPVRLSFISRLGFSGLRKWLSKRSCYFRKLGANFVELQPIQEFDAKSGTEYHWGYMPVNYFCPASTYAKDPENGTQVKEFKKLVRAFHKRKKSVILDVVYNHFGSANHLANIDPDYYFRHTQDGNMLNYSGCGNDLRTESPMVQRLVLDSLKHMVETYNIDGFRFDLGELVGANFIKILQNKLKKIKPSLSFIIEPWSFRGYIGNSVQNYEFSCWNDEYREFIAQYANGKGNTEGIRYFLSGSLGYKTKSPTQTVNYVSSHDDLCWIDKITENVHNDGRMPTEHDIIRTHLTLATMMCSLGVPMIAQGMDFFASKHGVNNTYQRGDLNALDYSLIKKFPDTHRYFRRFIKLRLSRHFAMLRIDKDPGKDYFKFFSSSTSSACVMLFNANKSCGSKQLIFAINPHDKEISIDISDIDFKTFKKIADEKNVFIFSRKIDEESSQNRKIILRPMSCDVFISKMF